MTRWSTDRPRPSSPTSSASKLISRKLSLISRPCSDGHSDALSNLLEETNERLGQRPEPEVLTLTEKHGFVSQRERFTKRIATEDTTSYKIVRRFDLAFNPYLLWAGAIAQNVDWDTGIVSPAYPTFRVRSGLDPRYVNYLLHTGVIRQRYDSISFGSVPRRRRATTPDFLALEVPGPPPIKEQRRIADILDRADALRAKRREALAHLTDLTQSIFLDMFGEPVANHRGWVRRPLGAVLRSIDSGTSPVCEDRQGGQDEWAVLKLGAVTRCVYMPEHNKALKPDTKPRPEHEVKPGDLLFSRKNTRDLVAACALVRRTPPRLLLPDLIFRLNVEDRAVEPIYLQQSLVSPTKRQQVQGLAGGSAGSMPNISKTRLRAVDIELPPAPLQAEFAKRVDLVEAGRNIYLDALAAANELFSGLQQRAFAAQL